MAGRLATSALAALVTLGLAGCGGGGRATTPTVPGPAPHPEAGAWLGLAFNSSSGTGGLELFARRGIVYDRSGPLEVTAGRTVTRSDPLGQGLAVSMAAGMIPDIDIDPAVAHTGCTGDPNASTLCLPVGSAQITAYVHGFVATATSVRRTYPGRRVIFEPMNEPWGWGWPPNATPQVAATEYAAVLASLLPTAAAAGIPLTDIYVAGDDSDWIPELYAARPCLANACGPIEGWNLHSYGLPGSRTEGIGEVPVLRRQMLSGQDNVIVSELGFCAVDVEEGQECNENRSDIDSTSQQASAWLSDTLQQALAMRRAGWLKALVLWVRQGGGWSMQLPNGQLTAQGRVLVQFAQSVS